MDKLLGFLPDADPTLPGVITECSNLIPFDQGMMGAPSAATPSGVPALASSCKGAAVLTRLDDLRRIIAGTFTKLYDLQSGAWTDVSTGSYLGAGDSKWIFAQFGNDAIATNGVNKIQRSSGAAFSDIASAPKAKIVFTVGNQLMALNVDDGIEKPNGWHCCATYDASDWVTSITTLCASGQLVSSPGKITAGGGLGEYAVAYKEKAIHLGRFVGAPTVWDWIQVPGGDAGCIGLKAWCDIGALGHFIVGSDSFYIFDGTRPVEIGYGEVRQWFYDVSSPQFRYKTECVYDRQNRCVWILYPSIDSAENNKALVYHLPSKKWGKVDITPQAALNYVSAGVSIDQLGSFSPTIDGLSSYSFDSQFWLSGGKSFAVFNSSNQLQSLTAPSISSSLVTGDIGDDNAYTLLTKVRARFYPGYKPTEARIETFSKAEEGATPTLCCSAVMNDGKFDVVQSGRWHRGSISFTGDHRLSGLTASLTAEGDE
jgi:hypothetical protein